LMRTEKIQRAVIVSAIGSLENVSFRNLKKNIELPVTLEKTELTEIKGPLELLSLEGSMMPMEGKPFFHLHGMFGTTAGEVVGGHMFSGRVYTTLEITFAEMKDCTIVKAKDNETGLPEYTVTS
ncbi:MAG: PPC domain-containing DNA-binding protein, partial [Candidatus Bathyarchaeia archaeon]